MTRKTILAWSVLGALVTAGMVAGCGSDDTSSSQPGSFGDVVSALDAPTGTLNATSAAPVAKEFEKSTQMSMNGSRQVKATQQQDMSAEVCQEGGSANASVDGNESSGKVRVNYGNCCMAQGCCVDGSMDSFYNSDSNAKSKYSMCITENITFNCEGESGAVNFSGCLGSTGQFVYSVKVDGKTYTVTGSYGNGNGSLTITGTNGTWTCTYTDGSGSCAGSGGDFTFASG